MSSGRGSGARRHEVRRQDVIATDGTRLALYRLGDPAATPVVMMPGTFSNHTFWLGTRGHGLAWSLAGAGFEGVILDPRGHGGSDRPASRGERREWNFDRWGRVDAPAAIEAATDDGRKALLVGHSAGGAAMLIALAAEPELRERVTGIVLLGTPVPWLQRWRKIGAWGIRTLSRALGRFPARIVGIGPEDELPEVMAQWMTWNLHGEWEGEDGTDYVAELANVRVPVLGMSGAGDTVFAPPHACRSLVEMLGSDDATYRLAGTETGFTENFDHPGIVVSRAARAEVWPLLVDWLREHRPGG